LIVVLLGPPGAGKGTQGERIAAALGIPKLATGDVLRAAVKDGTKLGLEAKAYMDRGDLVPDAVILGIIKEALLSTTYAKGAILDGVVRTVPQAEGLKALTSEIGKTVDCVLDFEIEDELLVARLSGRTTCDKTQKPFTGLQPGVACPDKCGGTLVRRKDDEPEAVRNRLKVYHAQTKPVLDWYVAQGANVQHINAVGSFDDVFARAMQAVGR
jgi:adenylate kinase